MRRPLLLSILLIALAALPVAAQHPNVERGFAPGQSFQIGDIDHVNLFNGSLVITIPLGPVIDRFLNGVATSVKSIDLAAPNYQNVANLGSKLKGFIDKLASFKGATLGGHAVGGRGRQITAKVLELIVQKGTGTAGQVATIHQYTRLLQS